MVLILRTQQIAMTVFRGFIFSRIVRATISSLSPAGHDNWRIELIPPEGSGFTSATLKRVDLSAESNKVFVMGLVDAQAPSFVSGPTLKRVSDQTVVIAWQSSEPATSVVSGSGLPAIENRDLKVNHEGDALGSYAWRRLQRRHRDH